MRAGTLVGVSLAAALVPLGSTMVAVSLVDVGADLEVSAGTATWLVTGYLAAMALAQPAGGRAGDRWGHRRVFGAGLAAYIVLSGAAALAPGFGVLVAARAGQAVAGALMLPNASALIRDGTVPGGRGRAFGVLASALALAAALGPIVGGLVGGGLGWRALFLVPVPAGLLAWALLGRGSGGLRPSPRPAGRVHTLAPLRRRAFRLASATILLHNLALYAALLAGPVVAHTGLGLGHGASAVVMAWLTGGLLAGALLGGRAADRHGRRVPAVVGGALAAVGAAPLPLVAGAPSPASLTACLAVLGMGIGLAGPGLQAAAVEAAPPGAVAAAGGLYMSARYLGGIAAGLLAGWTLGAGAVPVLTAAAAAAAVSALTAAGLPGGAPWAVGMHGDPPPVQNHAGTRPRRKPWPTRPSTRYTSR
jgi:DHA2 family methylenomycin A resistance protein-like MFS transporter